MAHSSCRVKTALRCVLLVCTDQVACPPVLAITTHLAPPSTAPASAGRVDHLFIDSRWRFVLAQEPCKPFRLSTGQ